MENTSRVECYAYANNNVFCDETYQTEYITPECQQYTFTSVRTIPLNNPLDNPIVGICVPMWFAIPPGHCVIISYYWPMLPMGNGVPMDITMENYPHQFITNNGMVYPETQIAEISQCPQISPMNNTNCVAFDESIITPPMADPEYINFNYVDAMAGLHIGDTDTNPEQDSLVTHSYEFIDNNFIREQTSEHLRQKHFKKYNRTEFQKDMEYGQRPNNSYKYCHFCHMNNETIATYRSHNLYVKRCKLSAVECPVLRKYQCPNCGATGDNAHTVRHCPVKPNNSKNSVKLLQRTNRSSSGFRIPPRNGRLQ